MRRFHYAVLGAGRQGTAAAYDLGKYGNAQCITLVDTNSAALEKAIQKLLCLVRGHTTLRAIDAVLPESIADCDAWVNALPYSFGVDISKMAIEAKIPVCDLGCDTDIVRKQLRLSSKAKRAEVAIVPDCGLAPGSSTMFAMYVYNRLKEMKAKPDDIRLYCGGLPERTDAAYLPLKYKVVFSLKGLLNNYRTKPWVLSHGTVTQNSPLGNLETIDFDGEELEAFDSAGGASLLPWKFKRKGLTSFSYKTLRYPEHVSDLHLLESLGLMALEDERVESIWKTVIANHLCHPGLHDVVFLRGQGVGVRKNGYKTKVTLDLIDKCDDNFSAMERTTGFAAGIVAFMLARRKIKPGVHTPDDVIPPDYYIKELTKRGFYLTETTEGRL